jgi:hypothetical protein
MTDTSQMSEIAVAAALTARAFPKLDHDEIGVFVMSGYGRLMRDARVLHTAQAIADETRRHLRANVMRIEICAIVKDVLAARLAVLDQSYNWGTSFARAGLSKADLAAVRQAIVDRFGIILATLADENQTDEGEASASSVAAVLDRIPGAYDTLLDHAWMPVDEKPVRASLGSEGNPIPVRDVTSPKEAPRNVSPMVVGESASRFCDPASFAGILEALDRDGLYAHASDALDASVECWSDMRSVRLVATPGTHKVTGMTISMQAVLEIVESDGKEETVPVLAYVENADLSGSPLVIGLLDPSLLAMEDVAFARRLSDVELALVRDVSDVSVDHLSHGWDEVDAVDIAPVDGTYARTGLGPNGRGVSMLVVASFVFVDGSRTQGHLTYVMDEPDDGLLTGRFTCNHPNAPRAKAA